MVLFLDGEKLFWKVFGRIPRPERSGVVSIVVHVMLMCGILASGESSLCGFLPWPFDQIGLCRCEVSDREVRRQIPLVMPLYFGSGPGDDKDTCHADVRTTPELPNHHNPVHLTWFRAKRGELHPVIYSPYVSEGFPTSEQWEDVPLPDMGIPRDTTVTHVSSLLFMRGNWDAVDIPIGYKVEMRWDCEKVKAKPKV